MSDLAQRLFKRIPVLDKGFVELQDLLPHPETGITPDNAIVAAARVSFLGESKGDEKDAKLISYLIKHRHTSPFEQVVFKFRMKAPLVTWWQLTRHRTMRLNLQSGRYTEFPENEFYAPAVWRKQSPSNKQASLGELDPEQSAELTADLLAHYAQGYALYEKALGMGVSREMARVFLPGFSVYYMGIVQVDLHNLFHFLGLRMAEDAQYEIRVYAQAMYQHFVMPAVPIAAAAWEKHVLGLEPTTHG
jgi:thymidylate synthase (FAD)